LKRLVLLVLLVSACHAGEPEWQRWSQTAAARHAEADRLLDQGQRVQATEQLQAVIEGAPGEPNDAVRVVLQDTRFRLARLLLDEHQAQQALDQADAGLALSRDLSLFRANLLVVRGAALEALGRGAEAVDVYQQALRINEALLRDTLAPR
jgi:tetratricopeptide (TPR) repeat protein